MGHHPLRGIPSARGNQHCVLGWGRWSLMHKPLTTTPSTYERGPKKLESIYKKLCILTCLNFNNLQSTLHLMQYTYWGIFFTAPNSFWTCRFWCLLVFLPFFVSPVRTFFHLGKQENSHLGWDRVNREGGAWGHAVFLVKNCWPLSVVWAGVLIKPPSENRQIYWRVFKKIHWSWMQSLTTPPTGTLMQMGSYWETSINQHVTWVCAMTGNEICNVSGVWDNAPANWATWPGLILSVTEH